MKTKKKSFSFLHQYTSAVLIFVLFLVFNFRLAEQLGYFERHIVFTPAIVSGLGP
jgi:hypothetical protein